MEIKKVIGFCGCGQAGSNIVDVAERKGYVTGVINTSPEDLSSVNYVRNKLQLGKNGGAGKDRSVVKGDLKEYYTDILDFVHKNFILKGVKILYIVCSASGGTGSGMSPTLIKLLQSKFPSITVGCIAVLPDATEVLASQTNSLEFLKEISTLEIPLITPDNQKFMDVNGKNNISKHTLFSDINDQIISYFDEFCADRASSKMGNMDVKDKLEILTTNGVTVMSHLYFDGSEVNDQKPLHTHIMDSFDSNIFATIEYNKCIIKKTGFIFEVNNRVSSLIDYTEIFKNIGTPLKNFEGVYPVQQGKKNYVLSMLTGLELPATRIAAIKSIIENEKERVKSIKKETDLFGDVDTAWMSDFDSKPKAKAEEVSTGDIDLESIFNM